MDESLIRRRRPPMKDIAAQVGVSVATVWRVLNNRTDVKPATRQRVLSYLREKGYEAQVTTAGPRLIGVVDTFQRHGLSSYYLSAILEGADTFIHSLGYATTLIHSDTIERDIRDHGHATTLRSLSGVLWMEPVFTPEHADMVREHHVPCVVINNCDPDVPAHVIESDNFTAAKLATEFLIGHGHTDIGFVGGWLELTNHADRFRGYSDAMRDAGMEPNERWIVSDLTLWNDEGGREGIHRLLSSTSRPSAVIVCSDFLINGVYAAVDEMGYRVPDDLSVISFDDFPMAAYMNPPLTSCRQPLREMGTMAAQRLMQIIDRPYLAGAPERTYVRMPFIVRKSTRSLR